MQYAIVSNNNGLMMPAAPAVIAAPAAPVAYSETKFSSAAEAYAALRFNANPLVQQSGLAVPAPSIIVDSGFATAAPSFAPVTVPSQPAVTYAAAANAPTAFIDQPAVTYAAPAAAPITYAAPAAAPTIVTQPVVTTVVEPSQQAVVTSTVGEWQICQDNLGEFYFHTVSGQTFDQAPPELLQLLGMQSAAPYVVSGQSAGVSYAAQPAAAVLPQATPVPVQVMPQGIPAPVQAVQAPVPGQESVIKATVGDWMICQDAMGEFYSHTPTGQTFDQAPPELLQLLGGAQAPAQEAAPAMQPAPATAGQSVVKSVVGDWQICEDAMGEFYCHSPSGQTFDQPPAELMQLLGMVG